MSDDRTTDEEDTISVPLPDAESQPPTSKEVETIEEMSFNLVDVGSALESMGRVITFLNAEFDRLRKLIEGEEGATSHGPPDPVSGLTPCCGRSVLDIPMTERISFDGNAVTCTGSQKAPQPN